VTLFRIVWTIAVIVALVAVFFFVWGVQDGSVSSFNIVLWIGFLTALGAIVFGSRAMHRKGHRALGTLIAALPAVPALLYGVVILVMMFSGSRWN
jgi:hypothetical protein